MIFKQKNKDVWEEKYQKPPKDKKLKKLDSQN